MIKSKVGCFLCCFLKICDETIAHHHVARFQWCPSFRIVSCFCLKFTHECEILHSPLQHKLILLVVFSFNNTSDVITSYWLYKIKLPDCESRDVIGHVSLCDQDICYIKEKPPSPREFSHLKIKPICFANLGYANCKINH